MPARVLVPALAVVLAVFGTSRLMESIAPDTGTAAGERASGSDTRGTGGDRGRGDRRGGGGTEAGGGRQERRRRRARPSSFYDPAGMRRLMALLSSEAGPGGRVALFRLQADAAQVQLARRSGGGRMVVVERGPRVRFAADTPVAAPGGFSPRDLDPYAPSRIGAAIERRSGASLRDVDYMVYFVSPIDREGGWDAFLSNVDHTHFHADAHGRHVTRP